MHWKYWFLGLLPLGRVPPGFLVGEGARDWAIRHGIHTVSSEKLVSDKAVKLYKVSKRDTWHFYNQQKYGRCSIVKIFCVDLYLVEVFRILLFIDKYLPLHLLFPFKYPIIIQKNIQLYFCCIYTKLCRIKVKMVKLFF